MVIFICFDFLKYFIFSCFHFFCVWFGLVCLFVYVDLCFGSLLTYQQSKTPTFFWLKGNRVEPVCKEKHRSIFSNRYARSSFSTAKGSNDVVNRRQRKAYTLLRGDERTPRTHRPRKEHAVASTKSKHENCGATFRERKLRLGVGLEKAEYSTSSRLLMPTGSALNWSMTGERPCPFLGSFGVWKRSQLTEGHFSNSPPHIPKEKATNSSAQQNEAV